MQYKIIVDSSSNLLPSYLSSHPAIGFAVAPLTIRFGGKEYVDDENLDVEAMLRALEQDGGAASSACPAPGDFLKHMEGAEHYIVITISQKLSGAYASALTAKSNYEHPDEVFVLDSKLVCGSMEQLVVKAVDLIEQGLSFEEIQDKLTEFRDTMNLLFVLNKFDNLIRNGRMNKIVAFIAQLVGIKPLCYGKNGEIQIKEKVRTLQGVYKRLVHNIGTMCPETEGKTCIISHTLCENDAIALKQEIEKRYHFKEVKVEPNRGLCAFYSLEGGIIVCFA